MILWCFLLISIINFGPLLWPFSDRWGKDLDNKSWIYTTYQKAYVKFWKLYTGFLVLEKNISKHSTLYSFFLYRIPFKGDLVCASSEQTWKPSSQNALCNVDASLVEIGHLVFKMKLKISKVYINDEQQKKLCPEKLSFKSLWARWA